MILEKMSAAIGQVVTDTPSAAGNWLRPTLVAADPGKVSIAITIRPEMCNPYGNIHGGMMALLIDEAIGWAVVSLAATQHYTSMNLVVDFLYAAAKGEQITATAFIIRHGKKVINTEVKVYNTKNVLLAKASSNLITTNMNIKANAEG